MKEIIYARYDNHDGISFNNTLSPIPTRFPTESHNHIEILYLVSGKIQYLIDGHSYNLLPGEVIIINSGEIHSLTIDPTIPYHRLNLHFSKNFIPIFRKLNLFHAFENTKLYHHILPQTLVKESAIYHILKKISSLCLQKAKYQDAKIVCLIQDLVIEINTVVDNLIANYPHLIPVSTQINPYILSAINYINSNLTKNLTIASIASFIGLAEEYFQRLFKKTMGVTPAFYIENQKMQRALSLLRDGHQPKAIATMLGFDYYATFYNKFKRIFNVSPSQIISSQTTS